MIENICHIFVQDGGEHAAILVHAAHSDCWQTGGCAVGNGTSRDRNAAAAMTLPLFQHYIHIYLLRSRQLTLCRCT